MIVAGGTSLAYITPPARIVSLVDITGLNLNYVRETKRFLHLGATLTLNDIALSEPCRRLFNGILSRAALSIAGCPVRNLVTLGGNCVGQFSWSILPVLLLALDARFVVTSPSEKRSIRADEFYTGRPSRKLQPESIITEVRLPLRNSNKMLYYGYFKKFSRVSTEFSFATLASSLLLDKEHLEVKEARIVMGSLSPFPQRLTATEAIIKGNVIREDLVEALCKKAQEEVSIAHDLRCSVEYKREITGVLIREMLEKASTEVAREKR